MKKKLLTLLPLLLCCIAILASCGGNLPENSDPSSADTTAEITEPVKEEAFLFTPGVCEYRIVYPSDDTDEEFTAARKLQSLIEEKCGVKPELVRSTMATDNYYDPNVKEIFLSYVDVDEFDLAISQITYTMGISCAIGNKIVITGHEREGFENTFESFVAWIEANTLEGKLVLPENFAIVNECKDSRSYRDFDEVPGYPGGKIEDVSDLGNGYDQVTIYDTDAEMYADYVALLPAAGYTLYSENEIEGNLYSTFTREDEMLYFYYCPESGETRVIIAEDVTLPALASPEYKKVCEPAYVTLQIYTSEGKVSGDAQGAIIRFEDGSFMVYDGGNKNNYQSRHIFDTLKAYAVDPDNIVIRAWVFSHFHSDHVGAFQQFVNSYKGNLSIKVESFIYNFCDTAEQTKTFSSGQMDNTEDAMEAMGADIPVYKCLTGQVFHFPGMDMEVLATMSDFIPQVIGYEASDADLSKGDGNTMTIVVRLKTNEEGNTCMLTGDATNIVLDDMVDRYGAEYLDSDIVTTPHHAHNRNSYRARNATIKFYDAVKPEILVVTSTNMSKFVPSTYPYEVNVHVLNTYDPEIYLMNEVRLISLATLKEIK